MVLEKVAYFILGEHPNNTCFSYNWHAVRHVRAFLRSRASDLDGKLDIADVGGGAAPYFELFRAVSASYTVVDLDRAELSASRQAVVTQLIGRKTRRAYDVI